MSRDYRGKLDDTVRKKTLWMIKKLSLKQSWFDKKFLIDESSKMSRTDKVNMKNYLKILCILLVIFFVNADINAIALLIDAITRSFAGDHEKATLFLNAYIYVFALVILFAGSIGKRVGRMKVFQWGVFYFILGSLGCGISRSANLAIFMRFIQGLGSATLWPNGVALIVNFLPTSCRGTACAIFAGILGMSVGLGPYLGLWIANHSSWQWVFLINVPLIGVISLFLLVTSWDELEPRK